MPATLENVSSEVYKTWSSLNTAADPTKISKEQTPRAVNVLPDEKPGSIVTSTGYTKVGDLPSGNACRFMYTFEKSDGTSMVLLSDGATVYKTTDFITITSIITGLSSSFQLRAATIRDKVWLTNGNDSVRTYDGSAVVVLDGTSSTPNVPKGKFIEIWQERVWLGDIPSKRSSLRFSALVDNTGADITPDDADAWPTINEIQCGQDDGDVICGLKVYQRVLHPFKGKSIYRIDGYDEFTYQPSRTGASTGCRLQESIQERDDLLEFIGKDGLYEFNGQNATKVSDIIESVELTQFSFNNIQQGTNQQLSRIWTSESDFTAGTLTRVSATRESGSVIIDGFTYAADFLPASDDPVWTKTTLRTTTESVGGGILSITALAGTTPGTGSAQVAYTRTESGMNNTNGTRMRIRCKMTSTNAGHFIHLKILDGTKQVYLHIFPTQVILADQYSGGFGSSFTHAMTTTDAYHTYDVVLEGATATLYTDDVSRGTCTPTNSGSKEIAFGINVNNTSGVTATGEIDYVSVIFSTTSGSQALSEIYQITDTIATWGAFQATYLNNGGSLAFFVRSGTSSSNCAAASWTAISPGATIAFATANVFIQWRIDFTASGVNSPILDDVTINWTTSSASVVTTQLVASVVHKARYWLSGASTGSSTNDTVILRGKRLYDAPFIKLSGFNITAFCVYSGELYGASSTNDDLFRLDTGYSLNGSAMDSYWETRDEVGGADEDFYKRFPMIIVTGIKKGNYNLTVDASIDGGATFPAGYQKTISLSGSGRLSQELRYESLRGKQVRFRFRTNGVDQPWDLSSVKIFWQKKLLR